MDAEEALERLVTLLVEGNHEDVGALSRELLDEATGVPERVSSVKRASMSPS